MREATEVAQYGDPRLARVVPHQRGERVVERDQLPRPISCDVGFVQLDRRGAGSSLGGESLARVIDEDLAHASRGDGEEVRAIGKLDRRGGESQIDLGDQVGGIERGGVALSPQMTYREPPELAVDERIDATKKVFDSIPGDADCMVHGHSLQIVRCRRRSNGEVLHRNLEDALTSAFPPITIDLATIDEPMALWHVYDDYAELTAFEGKT